MAGTKEYATDFEGLMGLVERYKGEPESYGESITDEGRAMLAHLRRDQSRGVETNIVSLFNSIKAEAFDPLAGWIKMTNTTHDGKQDEYIDIIHTHLVEFRENIEEIITWTQEVFETGGCSNQINTMKLMKTLEDKGMVDGFFTRVDKYMREQCLKPFEYTTALPASLAEMDVDDYNVDVAKNLVLFMGRHVVADFATPMELVDTISFILNTPDKPTQSRKLFMDKIYDKMNQMMQKIADNKMVDDHVEHPDYPILDKESRSAIGKVYNEHAKLIMKPPISPSVMTKITALRQLSLKYS